MVDMREEQEVANSLSPDSSFPSALDKERNEANENNKWIGKNAFTTSHQFLLVSKFIEVDRECTKSA